MSQVLYNCNTIKEFEELKDDIKNSIINNKKDILKSNDFLGDISSSEVSRKIKIRTFDLPRVITCEYASMVEECKFCYQKKSKPCIKERIWIRLS